MPAHLVTVCLPATADTAALAARATAAVTGLPHADRPTLVGHFAIRPRWFGRGRHLVQPVADRAAGGRLDRLDLHRMRCAGRDAYWRRWQIWHQVAAGTPVARPYWTFLARHVRDPRAYGLVQARRDYAAQPRLQAMAIYNALPQRVTTVPADDLEFFQAGAHAYAHLGWLWAVVGDMTVTLDGVGLAPVSGRFADVLVYLQQANAHITALAPAGHLVAVGIQA